MMRRTVVIGAAAVVVVVVLATPVARRGVRTRLDAVADGVRDRVTAFRVDYATRETELRRRLLPTEEQQERAAQHRAATH